LINEKSEFMFVPFVKLPDRARIWIFQADRIIEPLERAVVDKELLAFTTSWKAHGNTLEASYAILEDFFIVLGVDEEKNSASGCSIDLSTQIIKQLEQDTGINFFNRTLVPFEIDGKVKQFRIDELKKKFTDQELNENSVTFNILADTIGTLRHGWRIPVSQSWIKRYITPRAVDSINR
jgi:hypothetical protein